MNPLQDDELNRALEKLCAPCPPKRLEANTLAAYRSEFARAGRWRRLFTMQVRVPLPAAAGVVAALLAASAMLARIEFRPQPKQPPVAVSPEPSRLPWGGLQPVGELRPVIIRGQHESN